MPNDRPKQNQTNTNPGVVQKLLWTLGILLLVPLSLATLMNVVMGLFYTLNGAWVDGLANMTSALMFGLPALIIGFILIQDFPKK